MKFVGKKVLLRADGGEGIGMGKLVTTLTLARKLQSLGADVFFVTVKHHMWPPGIFKGIKTKILPKGFFQESIFLTDKEINKFSPALVVLNVTDPDIYLEQKKLAGFNEWVLNLRKRGIKVLGIEGYATRGYRPDVLVNWTIVPEWHQYEKFQDTKYFIGGRYAILREPFTQVPKAKVTKRVKYIFVGFGGGTEGVEQVLFPRIMIALSLAGFSGQATFVIGPAYQNPGDLLKLMARWKNAQVLYNIPVERLARIMSRSDLSITSGGVTLYELACLGVPSLTIPVVSHQVFTLRAFQNAKATLALKIDPSVNEIQQNLEKLLLNVSLRKQISQKGRKLIDGKGLERILSIIEHLL